MEGIFYENNDRCGNGDSSLALRGCKGCFWVSGWGPFYTSMMRFISKIISPNILARHEQGAVHAADG